MELFGVGTHIDALLLQRSRRCHRAMDRLWKTTRASRLELELVWGTRW
jgi:hypothetical protein